jgi:hypothetical protein
MSILWGTWVYGPEGEAPSRRLTVSQLHDPDEGSSVIVEVEGEPELTRTFVGEDATGQAFAYARSLEAARNEVLRMAEGGVVDGPVEAVVGEDGPEAVTPIEPGKAEEMAERMAEVAEAAAGEVEVAAEEAEGTGNPDVVKVLEALADFAEGEAEEAEEAAEEAEEAAEEGDTAEAAAAATEAAAHAQQVEAASDAAEEIAPRRRGFARVWWG